MYFDTVNPLLRKKCLRKRITKYFVSKYIWLIRSHICNFTAIHFEYMYWTNVDLYHLQNVYSVLPFLHKIYSP